MAGPTEVRSFAVVLATGSTPAAPQITAMTMPQRTVKRIVVRVPPGPQGTMGWAIGSAGVPVFPIGTPPYIVTDNEVIVWDVIDQIDSGAWQLIGYNTDLFPHTVYVRFECYLPDPPVNVNTQQPIASSALTAPPAELPVAISAGTAVSVGAGVG